MKRVLIVTACLIVFHVRANVVVENKLDLLEVDAQKTMQGFYDLAQNMSISAVSESIVSHNAQKLESALGDLVDLNKTVHSQVNVAVQFWNMYLETVKVPTMETYLLGQVMNSLIGTIRALSLRSSVDQAMILSFIKTHFISDDIESNNIAIAANSNGLTIEDRWQSMLQ